MTAHSAARDRRPLWACGYGTLAIVAAYIWMVARQGQPTIPGHVGLALVGVLTWVAVQAAVQPSSAPMSITKRYRTSLAITRS